MIRRKILLPLLLVCSLMGFAYAAPGGADDPLVSLDYLTSVFAPKAESAAQERLDASGFAAYDAAEKTWRAALEATEAALGGGAGVSDVWQEARLKQGDTVAAPTGAQLTVLAGDVTAQIASGAVVDVTDGTELASGAALKPRHRCLAAENANAQFTVKSRTAVVLYCSTGIARTGTGPDCNAMASALRELSLFRGTDTAYGEGFDLEVTPTRIQALIMLIRLLGEEDAALACTSPSPFRDVADGYWGRPYIVYAYEKGYTNGVENNNFAPDRPVNAGMYVEFILRALGCSDTTQTDVSTSAARAVEANVLTAGEKAMLETNAFLRADVVYLSWYALDAPVRGTSQTLREKLLSAGVFTAADDTRARAMVTSARL